MQYRHIDLETFKRKEHFLYFSSLAYPYVGVTANVDITELLAKIKGEKLPFFLTVCYCVTEAANRVPEMRQRIQDGGIIEFERCRTSHTVALEDGTYCYCTLEGGVPLREYLAAGQAAQEAAKTRPSIHEAPEEVLDMIFVSTLPGLSYTALVQPAPMPADSNPRITWGKYFQQEGRTLLPLTALCSHALVDGMHLSAFYAFLDEEIQKIAGKT